MLGTIALVGSIANLIVADAAARRGIRIDWRTRGRAGVPVTLATLALSAGCFGWRLGGV